MRKIDRLKKEAAQCAKMRGHHLRRYRPFGATSVYTMCRTCGRLVIVKANPMPNEIEIGGGAVAVDCQEGSVSDV